MTNAAYAEGASVNFSAKTFTCFAGCNLMTLAISMAVTISAMPVAAAGQPASHLGPTKPAATAKNAKAVTPPGNTARLPYFLDYITRGLPNQEDLLNLGRKAKWAELSAALKAAFEAHPLETGETIRPGGEWERSYCLAMLHLYARHPAAAIQIAETLWRNCPEYQGGYRTDGKGMGAILLAYAAIETGSFSEALHWIDETRLRSENGQWCGNGAESAAMAAHVWHEVCQVAVSDSRSQEMPKLKNVALGAMQLPQYRCSLHSLGNSIITQRAQSMIWSSLILGEEYERHGDIPNSQKWFARTLSLLSYFGESAGEISEMPRIIAEARLQDFVSSASSQAAVRRLRRVMQDTAQAAAEEIIRPMGRGLE